MVGERRQVGGVLADEPVEELLEGLAGELPEEDERISTAETALEPVEDWGLSSVVEPVLQNGSPDPGTGE